MVMGQGCLQVFETASGTLSYSLGQETRNILMFLGKVAAFQEIAAVAA